MKIILPSVLLVAFAAAPVSAQPATRANAPATQVMPAPVLHSAPSNIELMQALNSLSTQVAQLQSEVANLQGKLDAAKQQANDDYQRTNYRILQTCQLAYLRSFKAGDNPSSGQSGNKFLPDMWCDIGSYPYWKAVK